MKTVTRRSFLVHAGGAAGLLSVGGAANLFAQSKETGEINVSPAEDLMREHGVLRRILFIYQEWIKRLEANKYEQTETLHESARIVHSFVEEYHEKLEEEYLFPRFKKAGKLVDLVNILLEQHRGGRKLTEATLQLSNTESLRSSVNRESLARLLTGFIRMYQPHAAREDTVLFPSFHDLVRGKEYDKLGDVFEDKENELFGKEGFEKMVDRVASIEKKLGIYDLAQFTPKNS